MPEEEETMSPCDYEPRFLEQLLDAIGGAELTDSETRILKWLAGWDQHTVDNMAAIIRKAREAEHNRV